jgi:hypothetical protein
LAGPDRDADTVFKPDVPISSIRLSDWFHRDAHGEK